MIAPYKPFKNFNKTGVLSYFLYADYTGMGLGTRLLNELLSVGQKMGITNFLAHISSRNTQSINFHKKHGFEEVGRFKNIAVKFGEKIDIIWMQKQFGDL
jgi:L-amino acid N-acyltransferase YncA